jgi:hypothetical protein
MKNKLLVLGLLTVSSVAMAVDPNDPYKGVYDGYSSLNYSSTGYAQGNEANSSGGFCSITSAAGCGVTPGIPTAPTVAATDIVKSASGAGMNAAGNMALIVPTATTTLNAGTYTSIQGVTYGGYTVGGRNDPGSLGTVTGSAIALQKPDAGLASSGTVSDSIASSINGQAKSISNIVVQSQAITPN